MKNQCDALEEKCKSHQLCRCPVGKPFFPAGLFVVLHLLHLQPPGLIPLLRGCVNRSMVCTSFLGVSQIVTNLSEKNFVDGLAVITCNLLLVFITRDSGTNLIHGKRGQAQTQRICNALTTFAATQFDELFRNSAGIHYFTTFKMSRSVTVCIQYSTDVKKVNTFRDIFYLTLSRFVIFLP